MKETASNREWEEWRRERTYGVKKWLPCLKCGRKMYTDSGHRICRACHDVIDEIELPAVYLTAPARISEDDATALVEAMVDGTA